MNNLEKCWDYFFSFEGEMRRGNFIAHYFFDLFLFILLLAILPLVFFFYGPDHFELKFLEISLPLFLLSAGFILALASFIMNRLSIVIRRLKFLKMNQFLCCFILIPLIGLILEIYLMATPDENF